ncbi:hypothetical protein NCCP1664_16460 [Zafaria cholistanensis]|uniref:Uncharacterized protein n=1 Tax=Zafaria cholistanensis TaxID=1682741 RepID=A0A5A7NQS5_9MICC|nr:hypothetical protein [Zafaria cholistanensis]GER23150.1 hypothetical protein NCCP1664_16460 [Zafaria cholistanensis]
MAQTALWTAAPAGHNRPKASVPCGPASPAAPPAVPARAAAGLAAAAFAAHGLLLATHHHGPWLTALFAAMSLACGACAVKTWRRPSVHGLSSLLAMSLAMMVLHLALFLGPGGTSTGHGTHHAAVPAAPAPAGQNLPVQAAAGLGSGLQGSLIPGDGTQGEGAQGDGAQGDVQGGGFPEEGAQGGAMLGIAGLELAVAWSAGFALRRRR